MNKPHQVFTVFGGAYVGETREFSLPAHKRNNRSLAPLIVLLAGALIGATIPAVAFTASSRLRATEAARWSQPGIFLKAPAASGFDHMVF